MPVVNYIWDQLDDNVQLELDDTGNIIAGYENEPGQFGAAINQTRNGVTSTLHYDGQDSTRALTDSSQNVTDTFMYSVYGETIDRTGVTNTLYRFHGANGFQTDVETDSLYARRRQYAPITGRWLSADPLGFVDGPNLYMAYFIPMLVDPDGQTTIQSNRQNRFDKPAGHTVPGKVCAVVLQHGFADVVGANRQTFHRLYNPAWWEEEAEIAAGDDGAVAVGVTTTQEILDFVKSQGCCTLYIIGHRGGPDNPGGAMTYTDSGPDILLPSENGDFERELGDIFKNPSPRGNGCTSCSINIVTCGTDNEESTRVRRDIAESTGCVVCGSLTPIYLGCDEGADPGVSCTLGEPRIKRGHDGTGAPFELSRWEYECVIPYFTQTIRRGGETLPRDETGPPNPRYTPPPYVWRPTDGFPKGYGHCMSGDTPLPSRQGLKLVRAVREGDELLGYNIDTKQAEWTVVTNVEEYSHKTFHVLGFAGSSFTAYMTEAHPVLTVNGWRRAGELVRGERLICLGELGVYAIDSERFTQVVFMIETVSGTLLVGDTGLVASARR